MFFFPPLACATCQVNTAAAGGDAAGWSIFFLLIVILAMLGGIIGVMFGIIRRGSRLEPELMDDYVPAPRQASR
jgi:hypothetical protein